MFDLLSLAVCDKMLIYESDIIVLNSIAFINEVVQLLKKYQKILLLLDNDSNGNKITTYLLDQYKNVIDQSCVYLNYKDLNEKLIDGII